MKPDVRRIVTGHGPDGRSTVASDGAPPVVHVTPGGDAEFAELWETAAGPVAGEPLHPIELAPPVNGTRARIVEMRPRSASPMHRTETVDYGVVLSGEVVLVLEDAEVVLKPGDVVVQRGTEHAWDNRSDEPARLLFVLVDAANR